MLRLDDLITVQPRTIRTLIVDDEPLARERMRSLLGAETDIEVVGEARDGVEAVEAILGPVAGSRVPRRAHAEARRLRGDPDRRRRRMPAVVFVTAYDQHALRAFEVQALDYLLKPFDSERFQGALKRVRRQIDSQETGDIGRACSRSSAT